jgi:hypothetical protein
MSEPGIHGAMDSGPAPDRLSPAGAHPGMTNDGVNSHRSRFHGIAPLVPDGRLTCENCWRRCAMGLPAPADQCAIGAKTACAKKLILQAASSGSPRPVRFRKIFLFRFFRNWCLLMPSRLDMRGASRSSRTLRRDAVGVSMLQRGSFSRRRTASMRTVKSRGPDTPLLVSNWR